jgi:GNAT superfamily N-acetyltransferase
MVGSARRATARDTATLAELDGAARLAVAEQRGGPLFLAREARPLDLAAIDDPDALVIVGSVDEVPLGYAVVTMERLGDATCLGVLEALFVEPEARDVGVGEAMMDLVVEWCSERGLRGIDAIALPGDRATKNFFERFGLTARAILVHRPLVQEP